MTSGPINPTSSATPIKDRCTGRSSRTGEPCKNWPMKGSKVCHAHGGRAKQVKAAAKRRILEQETRRAAAAWIAGTEPIDSPLEALLEVAREITGFKDYLAGRVEELRESWRYRSDGGEQLRAEVALYERALDRTAKVLVDINRLGLDERRQALAEQQGALIASAMLRVLDALDLTPDQQARAVDVMPRELRALEGGTA